MAALAGALVVGLLSTSPLAASAAGTVAENFSCSEGVVKRYSRNLKQYGEFQVCASTVTDQDMSQKIKVKIEVRNLWWKNTGGIGGANNGDRATGRANVLLMKVPTGGKAPRTMDSHVIAVNTTSDRQDLTATFDDNVLPGVYNIRVMIDVTGMGWKDDSAGYILPDAFQTTITVPEHPQPM